MTFLYIIVGLVLVSDFINGFHDSANSIATVVSAKVLSPFVAALIAAISWNLLTWWWGLPSSSSHILVGGLVGAALIVYGITSKDASRPPLWVILSCQTAIAPRNSLRRLEDSDNQYILRMDTDNTGVRCIRSSNFLSA